MRRHDLAILVLGTALLGGWTAGASEVLVPVPQPAQVRPVPPETIGPGAPSSHETAVHPARRGAPIVRSSSDRRIGNGRASETVSGLLVASESRVADRSAHHRPGHNGVVYHSKP